MPVFGITVDFNSKNIKIMADSKKNVGKPDRDRISLSEGMGQKSLVLPLKN